MRQISTNLDLQGNNWGNDEDQMAYCNEECSHNRAGNDRYVGLSDWGTRNGEWTAPNGQHYSGRFWHLSYACRLDHDQTCDATNLVDRSTAMSAACNCGDGDECARGIPRNCPGRCGDAVVEFERACRSLIRTVPGMSSTIDQALENCRKRERSGGTSFVGVPQRMSWADARR